MSGAVIHAPTATVLHNHVPSISSSSSSFSFWRFSFSLSSCELYDDEEPIDPNGAQLNVYVYGALSQAPRENILVSVHWTREEAEQNINPIAGRKYTNEYGEVKFFNLPPTESYFVRAKPIISRTIRSTSALRVGDNYIDMPVP